MVVYFLSGKHFPRSRKHEILVPLSIVGVWKNDQKYIVDECASHMTLFVQALSLELARCNIYNDLPINGGMYPPPLQIATVIIPCRLKKLLFTGL